MDQEMYCKEILSGELSEGGCTREERNVKSVWKLLQRGESERANTHTLEELTACLGLSRYLLHVQV